MAFAAYGQNDGRRIEDKGQNKVWVTLGRMQLWIHTLFEGVYIQIFSLEVDFQAHIKINRYLG